MAPAWRRRRATMASICRSNASTGARLMPCTVTTSTVAPPLAPSPPPPPPPPAPLPSPPVGSRYSTMSEALGVPTTGSTSGVTCASHATGAAAATTATPVGVPSRAYTNCVAITHSRPPLPPAPTSAASVASSRKCSSCSTSSPRPRASLSNAAAQPLFCSFCMFQTSTEVRASSVVAAPPPPPPSPPLPPLPPPRGLSRRITSPAGGTTYLLSPPPMTAIPRQRTPRPAAGAPDARLPRARRACALRRSGVAAARLARCQCPRLTARRRRNSGPRSPRRNLQRATHT
mmetsp:Transcript_24371/g.84710  ORF Transcript_24371/g.84710 Transcript_24371/m.84710 type:complete len:288 (-) Transcript_24371:69-932(-)